MVEYLVIFNAYILTLDSADVYRPHAVSTAISLSFIPFILPSHVGDWRPSASQSPRHARWPGIAPESPHRCSIPSSKTVAVLAVFDALYLLKNKLLYSPLFSYHPTSSFPNKKWPKVWCIRFQLTLNSASVLAHQDVDHEAHVVVVLTRLEAVPEAATTTAETTVVLARR